MKYVTSKTDCDKLFIRYAYNGEVSLIVTFSERVVEVRDSPNSLNSFKILSYHHDNGNVLNQSSMDIDLFRTNLPDEI
jgi:hypothetical protein